MTTSKELNAAVEAEGGVRLAHHPEHLFSLGEAAREESDLVVGNLGVMKWQDSFRDPDEPSRWVVLYEHEGLLYSLDGSYDSWNGIDMSWAEFSPVQREEVTVVRYRTRKES